MAWATGVRFSAGAGVAMFVKDILPVLKANHLFTEFRICVINTYTSSPQAYLLRDAQLITRVITIRLRILVSK